MNGFCLGWKGETRWERGVYKPLFTPPSTNILFHQQHLHKQIHTLQKLQSIKQTFISQNGYHQERRQLRCRVRPGRRSHRLQGGQQGRCQRQQRCPRHPRLCRQGCRWRQV